MHVSSFPSSATGSFDVLGACPHDCPDTCSLVTSVRDGVAIKVHGNPEHPHTAGVLCTKVSRYTERSYHPERLLTPLKRKPSVLRPDFEARLRDIYGATELPSTATALVAEARGER